jgi:hypothetical protein
MISLFLERPSCRGCHGCLVLLTETLRSKGLEAGFVRYTYGMENGRAWSAVGPVAAKLQRCSVEKRGRRYPG